PRPRRRIRCRRYEDVLITSIMPIRRLCRPVVQRPWSRTFRGRCWRHNRGPGSEVLEELQERVRGLVAFLPAAGRGGFLDGCLLLLHVGVQVLLGAGEGLMP